MTNNTSNKHYSKLTGVTVDNSETAWTPPATIIKSKSVTPLTTKQKLFIKHRLENPKATPTASARAISDHAITDHYAGLLGHRMMTNDKILTELAKHDMTAQIAIVNILNDSVKYSKTGTREGASYAAVGVQAANSLLDRLHGKATTRVEQTSTAVTLNIDLTGVAASE